MKIFVIQGKPWIDADVKPEVRSLVIPNIVRVMTRFHVSKPE